MRTLPEFGRMSPSIILMQVVFPLPFGPRRAKVSPAPTSNESNRAEVSGDRERLRRRLAHSCRVVFFGDDDEEGEGHMLDISTSGCRISSDKTLPAGTVLKLSLFLNDHAWPMRIDEAIVRWAKEGTYGIEFTTIRLAQRERIRALVMKERSDT